MGDPPQFLTDANVLIALVVRDHVHHETAMSWFRRVRPLLYLCPIVEGALFRLLVQRGHPATEGAAVLGELYGGGEHAFVADLVSYTQADMSPVVGHRQVTDAYLAALARSRGMHLVTFDAGLRETHRDVAVLIPT